MSHGAPPHSTSLFSTTATTTVTTTTTTSNQSTTNHNTNTNCSINTALGRMRYGLINLRKMMAEKQIAL
jgi:hypothetical protein